VKVTRGLMKCLYFQFCDVVIQVEIYLLCDVVRFSHIWLWTNYESKNLLKCIYILATCLNDVSKHGDFKVFFGKKLNGENLLEKNLRSRVETKIVQMTPNHFKGNF
jgi:hypothetical protein